MTMPDGIYKRSLDKIYDKNVPEVILFQQHNAPFHIWRVIKKYLVNSSVNLNILTLGGAGVLELWAYIVRLQAEFAQI